MSNIDSLPSNLLAIYNGLSNKKRNQIKEFDSGDLKYFLSEYEQKKTKRKVKTYDEQVSVLAKTLEGEKSKGSELKEETKQTNLDDLMSKFYDKDPFVHRIDYTPELEVKFNSRGEHPLTRNDYDNVIKKLKSQGFKCNDAHGKYLLRINSEYLNKDGNKKMSNHRIEIRDLKNIQNYCRSNNIQKIYEDDPSTLSFIRKDNAFEGHTSQTKIDGVRVKDFNFSVDYKHETNLSQGVIYHTMKDWTEHKKKFRYLNRTTFEHDDYPFKIDISIVKSSHYNKLTYNIDESNVFTNFPKYEIEIEVDNNKIGPTTKYNNSRKIMYALRKTINFVLSGIQETNYPVSYTQQDDTLINYMNMIWDKDKDSVNIKEIKNTYFIGPNSITLQLPNISPLDEQTSNVNLRHNFVATEKADGIRHLLYIDHKGYIYLISQKMKVKYTGSVTLNTKTFNTIMDGELILHNKNKEFINMYAAFDIYYKSQKDVRSFPFMNYNNEESTKNARYAILCETLNDLNPVSIIDKISTPSIRITHKLFYPRTLDETNDNSIFNGCAEILSNIKNGVYEYETDGLIFTPMSFGVGGMAIGKVGPKTNATWNACFKWKPPIFNTVDFMISTEKETNGTEDEIKSYPLSGTNLSSGEESLQYKTIILRVGFDEHVDGYINPCQDIIDNKIFENHDETRRPKKMLPVQFYPMDPSDENAGICKIPLKRDNAGVMQMYTTEGNVFFDKDIVEFSYDLDKEEGWRWIPLRVRYDKHVGNKFQTANDNWKSIHYPITDEMISTGNNIQKEHISEDKYYNNTSKNFLTQNLKIFHNNVKRDLIHSVSKSGDSLIDYACGKAGDLPKWKNSRLKFVLGVDKSNDNLENRLNGACARYLDMKKKNNRIFDALFVAGNSAFNIKNGQGVDTDKGKKIINTIFGVGNEFVGEGVEKSRNVAENGFNISSCQFATHYFFEDADILHGFMTNVSQCTKLHGFFIGTAFDGRRVFNKLAHKDRGDSIKIINKGTKIFEITKDYNSSQFKPTSASIGLKIVVYQESINQYIPEYLINFDYFIKVVERYGFRLLTDEELEDIEIKQSVGSFEDLYKEKEKEMVKNKKSKSFENGYCSKLNKEEKEISFLNNYFIFKKIREVNFDNINLKSDLDEHYEPDNSLPVETSTITPANIEMNKKVSKPKIIKLNKTLVIVPAHKEETPKKKRTYRKKIKIDEN